MATSPKLFEKQILRLGKWMHKSAPNGVLNITKEYLQQLADNFQKTPFAPVTRGHVSQAEMEQNPSLIVNRNIKGLEVKADGLYAKMEIPEDELKNYNDVSASIVPDYVDHESGKNIGAVLNHVALVVNPYIKGLNPFVALADSKDYVINLSDIQNMEDENKVVEAELETAVTPEVEPEVIVQTPEPEVKADEVVVKETVEEPKVEEPPVEPTPVEASETDLLKSKIAELEADISAKNKAILTAEAQSKYDVLLHDGKIVPAQKESFINLYENAVGTIDLADGTKTGIKDMFMEFIAKMPKLISFEEGGVDTEAVKSDISETLIAELRASHKEMTDEAFTQWVAKNKQIIVSETEVK